MTERQSLLCETIKRLGYTLNNQVKLYGEVFVVVSEPISVSENLIFVDAIEQKSGRARRIRIPLPVIHMARKDTQKAA